MEFQAFDTSYVDKLRCGDEVTEQHCVGYFSELISLKLRSRLQSAQAIQDVRQETFARIFGLLRKPDGVRHGERLGALVNSICNNVLFEHYRSGKRSEPLEEVAAENLLDRQPDALRQAISQQTRVAVHEVLDSLGDRDRKVLRYLFVEERDKDAICEELGIDREYMRVLVHRAKEERFCLRSMSCDRAPARVPTNQAREGLTRGPAFPQRLKPRCTCYTYGGTEVPPLQNQDLFRASLSLD